MTPTIMKILVTYWNHNHNQKSTTNQKRLLVWVPCKNKSIVPKEKHMQMVNQNQIPSGVVKLYMEICGVQFPYSQGSWRRLNSCTHCPLKFSSNGKLVLHLRTHEVRNVSLPLKCQFCDKVCANKSSLRSHISCLHTAVQLKPKCSVCSKILENDEEVEAHEELHAARLMTDPFSCVLCNVKFMAIMELREHVMSEHEEGLLKCPDCNKSFLTVSDWGSIRILGIKPMKPLLKCPQCPYQALAPSSLRIHMFKHVETLSFKCEREGCDKVFKYPHTLNRHYVVDHTQGPETRCKFKCSLCPKAFSTNTHLSRHQRCHFSARNYLCEHCSQTFKTPSNLRTHKKVHETDGKLKGRRVPSLQGPRKSRLPLVLNVQAQLDLTQSETQGQGIMSETGNVSEPSESELKMDFSNGT